MKTNRFYITFFLVVMFLLNFQINLEAKNSELGLIPIDKRVSEKYSKLSLLMNHYKNSSVNSPESLGLSKDSNNSKKSPWLAFGLAIAFPGAGQIYNNEVWKGLTFFSLIVLGAGIGVLPGIGQKSGSEFPISSYIGFGIAGTFYIWSIIDAPISANNINNMSRWSKEVKLYSFEKERYTINMDYNNINGSFSVVLKFTF